MCLQPEVIAIPKNIVSLTVCYEVRVMRRASVRDEEHAHSFSVLVIDLRLLGIYVCVPVIVRYVTDRFPVNRVKTFSPLIDETQLAITSVNYPRLENRGLPNSMRLQHKSCDSCCLTFSPKALLPCVPQVLFFPSSIIFRAAWISLSSLYSHEQLYTWSAKVISFFSFPHSGQYFVVGALAGSTLTRSCFTSLAFTSPSTECCTVRPNSPLCQPFRFSSCIYTCSCSNRSCTILFAASRFLLVNF